MDLFHYIQYHYFSANPDWFVYRCTKELPKSMYYIASDIILKTLIIALLIFTLYRAYLKISLFWNKRTTADNTEKPFAEDQGDTQMQGIGEDQGEIQMQDKGEDQEQDKDENLKQNEDENLMQIEDEIQKQEADENQKQEKDENQKEDKDENQMQEDDELQAIDELETTVGPRGEGNVPAESDSHEDIPQEKGDETSLALLPMH